MVLFQEGPGFWGRADKYHMSVINSRDLFFKHLFGGSYFFQCLFTTKLLDQSRDLWCARTTIHKRGELVTTQTDERLIHELWRGEPS